MCEIEKSQEVLMQLSICIITKNEEKNITRCLSCLQPYDFEIVVVDTGSTDNTKKIAKSYTENVYDFSWCDDFAKAKNFAISKATNEFVMMIDSDEYLEPLEAEKLVQLIQKHPNQVGRIKRRNKMTRSGVRQENVEWINRIFSKEKFSYEGCIHEQVVAKSGENYETYLTNVVIEHSGYDMPDDERKIKAKRNIDLLLKELERLNASTTQDSINAHSETVEIENNRKVYTEKKTYILYQLGKSYFMSGDYKRACDYFSEGLSFDLNPKFEFVIDMVETYGYALINSGQVEDALFFKNIYEEFGNTADFQFLMGLIYMNNAKFNEAVSEFLKATTHTQCRMAGVNSYAAYYNIGVIYECLGNTAEAKKYYEKCTEYEPAKKRLQLM